MDSIQKKLEFLATLDVSETAIEIFKQFMEESKEYHPNSNAFRDLERKAFMNIGIEIGKQWNK